jgi:hypothetical protein
MPNDDKEPIEPLGTPGSTPPITEQDLLTETERIKIRLEEQFRLEIRSQLEEKGRKPSKLWTFLNSSFGLWLLSAIIVTWAGSIYAHWQAGRADREKALQAQNVENARNKELVERLDLEIAYRFSEFQINLVYLVNDWGGKGTHYPFRPGKGEKDVKRAIDSLLQPPQKEYQPLYPEFSNLSTLALIAELRRHVPPQEKRDLDQVIADLSGIYVFLEVRKIRTDDVYAVGKAVFNSMLLPRWSAGNFYFSDCPFC